MTSKSTLSFISATRDSAAATLRAGQVWHPTRSSACPSQKANPKSSATMRTVFNIFFTYRLVANSGAIDAPGDYCLLSGTCHLVTRRIFRQRLKRAGKSLEEEPKQQ